MSSNPIANPESISRFKKERFLLQLSEDEFRDQVIRPLFLRQGLQDGRDTCGPFEQGKDAVFIHVDRLGMRDLYVIQTKKGALNMSRISSSNVAEAITQLRTALTTKIPILNSRAKHIPAKVFLCCSGKINESSRTHIVDEVSDPRIVFLDANELIPKIDEVMPELWLGIDAELFPYLRAIKELVENPTEDQSIADIVPSGSVLDAATDAMFVQLRLHRTVMKIEKRLGKALEVPKFEDFPVTAIISRPERLVLILGEAGAGKSTSIKRLAYLLATRGLKSDTSYNIPVLIRATEVWAKKESSLLDVCVSSTTRLLKSSKPSFSNDDLNAGRVVVLMDALDELADDTARKEVVVRAREFHRQYPKCQVIITTRDYAFIKSLDGLQDFSQFHLFPINYKQAEQILKRFEKRKSLPSDKSKEILRRLQEVHGMELNPLLVTVFAATTDYSRRDIPANITELFKKYTEMMLGRWDATKGFSQQYHAPLKDFLLKRIGYEMHRRNVTSIAIDEFSQIVESELKNRGHQADVSQLADEILNRSGLFRSFGERIEFRHHLIQEFFAGRGIPNKELLQAVVAQEWWQRAIVFYFGEHPGESDIFDGLIRALSTRPLTDVYFSALTIGLALQACYLLKTEDKVRIFPWVINSIASAKELFLKVTDELGKYPLSKFLSYYIVGREAVACTVVRDHLKEIQTLLLVNGLSEEERDLRKFWILIGLMETGAIDQIKEEVRKFNPHDVRLLLAFHLGCFMLEHHRVAAKEEKKIAGDICKHLGERIAPLRQQLLKEWRSELIEIRKGEIRAIEFPSSPEQERELLQAQQPEPPKAT